MTREEAIEAMWSAYILNAGPSPIDPRRGMSAALDAARPWVEGLVREGVLRGTSHRHYGEIDAIAARVMGRA